MPGIGSAHIFGSWARRYLGESGEAPADIDLLVIGSPEPGDVHTAARAAEERLGRAVNVTILSETEWAQPSSGFLRAVRDGPRVEVPISR